MIHLISVQFLLYLELCSAEILCVADTEGKNDSLAQVVK
jgi:hypothetical protein